MTNAEKYLKNGVDSNDLWSAFERFYLGDDGMSIRFNTYKDAFCAFMNHRIKPTLTEDEKVILKNINKLYTHIRRDNEEELRIYCYTSKTSTSGHSMSEFNHLFQFIQPRRRI